MTSQRTEMRILSIRAYGGCANKGEVMTKQGNNNMIPSAIYVSLVVSVFFLSQSCLANDGKVAAVTNGMDTQKQLCGNSYVTGSETNVFESLARNVYIIHEKEVSTNSGKGSSTILGQLGLSDTLQGRGKDEYAPCHDETDGRRTTGLSHDSALPSCFYGQSRPGGTNLL